MTEKRYTTVELSKPNNWGIWYDGNYLSTYEVCHLLNEYIDAKKENEQLKDALNQRTEQCDKYYKENEQLKQRINELELLNDGLNYALKYIKRIDVEIDVE